MNLQQSDDFIFFMQKTHKIFKTITNLPAFYFWLKPAKERTPN